MLGERDITSASEITSLAETWVQQCLTRRIWDAGKSRAHAFSVEYAPMDVWGDGIRMSPHWLYEALDLGRCTTCKVEARGEGGGLQRCGRCGTAAYCSAGCQRGDWKVHRDICTMEAVERGKALKVSERGGLIGWDRERTFAGEGEEVESENVNFVEVQGKRVWRVGEEGKDSG